MFSPEMIGILGLVVLFILLMLRMPVGITMVLVGIGGTFALSNRSGELDKLLGLV